RHHRGADLDPLTGPVDRPSPTTSRVGVRGPTGPTRQSPGGTPYCQAPSPAEACAAIPSPTERSLIMHTRPLRRAAVLAVSWIAGQAGHHIGDYLVQRDCDAQKKQQRTPEGRRA